MRDHSGRQDVRPGSLANRVLSETIVGFTGVASRIGAHVGTLHRWRVRGLRGVRLEAARLGGRWVTSWEAIDRFTTAQSTFSSGPPVVPQVQDRGRARAVERKLAAEGL